MSHNATRTREVTGEMRTLAFLKTFWQDLHFGSRQLTRNPGFTTVAIITLALGIGANTAIFTLINAVMLKMLPVSHPEQLVLLQWESPHGATDYLPYPTFKQLHDHNQVFAGMFAFHSLQLATSIDGKPGMAAGQLVSGDYFSSLGVSAVVGRMFTSEETHVPGEEPFAVISYPYWQRQFGVDPAAVGKSIVLNGTPFTIIGVAPPGFFGVTVGDARDIWIPLTMQAQVMDGKPLLNDPKSWWLEIMARRKPEVSREQAMAGINVLYQRVARQQAGAQLSPQAEQELINERIALLPASKGLSDLQSRFSKPLILLMAFVGLVLLIACANIASLVLARTTTRQKEMALRAALGAGRGRLIRQLLTENLLLAGLGGLLGLLFANWGDKLLLALLSRGGTPLILSLRPDARVFIFTACVAFLTGILCGIAPAWKAARIDLNAALKTGARNLAAGAGSGRSRWGLRRLLVVGEVTLSLVLLVGAGMLARSLEKLKDVDPGFDQNKVLLVSVDPTLTGYQGSRLVNLYKQLTGAVSALPGVRSTSLSAPPPMSGAHWRTGVFAQGHVPGPNENTTALMTFIGPDFFHTLGIPLLRGRDFTPRDDAAAPKVVIINEEMARFYFGNASAIGKRLSFISPSEGEIEIVGVVQNTKYNSMRETTPHMIFLPYLQTPAASLPYAMTLEVRTAGSPDSAAGAVREAIRGVGQEIPIVSLTTLAGQVNRSLAPERLVADLSGFFGLLALLLASIGLYGVMAHTVARRTGEIGIRIALGAQRSQVLWMVLREALELVAIGTALGIPLALASGRLISSQLYGIRPDDPLTMLLAIVLLAVVASLASYFPARRATKVDPVTALRYE